MPIVSINTINRDTGYLMKKLNNQGFTHVVLGVLIVAVLAVVGFTGYTVMKHNKSHAGGYGLVGANVCGRSYTPWYLPTQFYTANGISGNVQLFVDKGAQELCLVNSAQFPGTGTYKTMRASLNLVSNRTQVRSGGSDSGRYQHYAGPVYLSIKGTKTGGIYCASVFASITYNNRSVNYSKCLVI